MKSGFVYLWLADVLYHRDSVIEAINIWTAASTTAAVERTMDLHCLVKNEQNNVMKEIPKEHASNALLTFSASAEQDEENFNLFELKRKQRSLYINSA